MLPDMLSLNTKASKQKSPDIIQASFLNILKC